LGLSDQIGSVEAGKRADLQLINLNRLHTTPRPDPISTIVYAAEASDVESVIIDGKIVMRDRDLITLKEHDVIVDARDQSQQLALRVSCS
jgi:cytosine/adenosine deaminase-related metal-dependent hydrolase